MIFVGLGANLPSPDNNPPQTTLEAAIGEMDARGIKILRRSRWYRSAPVPPQDEQGRDIPWYVNGVAAVQSVLAPVRLLEVLHGIERDLGRTRRRRWAPRVVDLDLLAYDDLVQGPAAPTATAPGQYGEDAPAVLVLPHGSLHLRSFVLEPLREIAPDWVHPVSGASVSAMIAALEQPTPVFAIAD